MKSSETFVQQVDDCCAFLRQALPELPRLVIQLGTGLGAFAGQLTDALALPFSEIPHFPCSTVPGHAGNLLCGKIHDLPVAILQGRVHYYEGYAAREVAFPIRVLSLLGARDFIVTNSAGGLNPLFAPGTIMIMRDHLNFLGDNPLRGPNIDAWGPRFPDLSVPYDPQLIALTFDAAQRCGVQHIASGTYVCIPGPSLETPAETRWLRGCGADAVGMSSIPEVLVARHAGMRVLGLSAISNVNDPDNFKPILLEEILATAAEIGPQLETLLLEILSEM